METTLQTTSSDGKNQMFKPKMWKPFWVDQNNNNIADTLDEEINSRLLNDTARDQVNVIVALRTQPTADDANAFALSGGYLTTSPWTNAIYGFGGQIPYNKITDFVQSDPNVLLVEKEAVAHATIAYAASQVGARTYVWNTLGLQGDTNSSIAIVDTGIDPSHPDFSPGFGDKNFTQKIVGWNDQISPGTTSPYDDGGHGSHVAGLAAGNGFFSTDASENAIATWGANLGALPTDTYYMSGMMVNETGLITIKLKWKNIGRGTLDTVYLCYGDKTLDTGSWIEVASVNPSDEDQFYTITYNVTSTPSGGYDMYHVKMSFTARTRDDFYVVFTMSWPYSPPADDFPAWTGIAPEAKLVGVKVLDYTGSGTDTGLLSAIDWIIANREAYHIVITSMSLGFSSEVSTVDAALVNLVNSGITTIVSAGNSGPGANNIYTPGSVDEVITVAATNQFDNIVHYSSQGGTSRYEGNTIKPDIAAPGGSFLAVPLLSADSNDGDADLGWSEVTLDDGAPMQGTSMSTPVVAGAASIIIQAMGGFANWQFNRSQALLPKMILLMTATETYPNPREYYPGYSPTLERGGKDAHEGYGRLNLDVAVDALLNTHEIGTTVTETLGKPPTLSDISVLGEKLAWARKMQLVSVGRYNFTLTVPEGADFDLYLYNSTGTWYGEPAIVAKSTNATTGGYEQVILTAPYNGTYYLAVKRATATTGGGTFTLEGTFTPNHDITVLGVDPSATSVYEGDKVNITVTAKNKGLNKESFNVTAFYNNSVIGTQTVSNLTASDTTTLNFTWNILEITPGNYTIKAQADSLPNEYNTTDNTLSYKGIVHIKIPGDVNSDDGVDVQDLTDIDKAFGSVPTSTSWNPECDFNRDNIINVSDLATLGKNYGKNN
jgi:subtilisin family serine protease